MTLGLAIIEELRNRRIVGALFDFRGYEKLRHVASVPELRELCCAYGYSADFASTDPQMIVDVLLQETTSTQRRVGNWFWWMTVLVLVGDWVFFCSVLLAILLKLWRF